jgi:hypothetical protein
MLVVLMLQELTHLTKGLATVGATVRQVRYTVVLITTIREPRNSGKVALQLLLLGGKIVNLLTRIVGSKTPTAVSAFHVLNRVGGRGKSRITADGTSHVAGSVHLHVHVQFVLTVERTRARAARIADCAISSSGVVAIHTSFAARLAIPFHPLVPTKVSATLVIIALHACSTHRFSQSGLPREEGTGICLEPKCRWLSIPKEKCKTYSKRESNSRPSAC